MYKKSCYATPGIGSSGSDVSIMLKCFHLSIHYVMGKVLTGKFSHMGTGLVALFLYMGQFLPYLFGCKTVFSLL